MNSFPLKYREASGAVLDNSDISVGTKVIYNVFDFYKSHDKVDISDDEYNQLIDLIAQDFELISAPSVKKDQLESNNI